MASDRSSFDESADVHEDAIITIEQWRPAMELQALCRIAKQQYCVVNSAYPLYISTGDLPQLRCGSIVLGGHTAAAWMRKRFHSVIDGHLSDVDQAIQTAMLALVHGKLAHVATWCSVASASASANEPNASSSVPTSRPPESTQLIWPLRWLLPNVLRNRAIADVEHCGWRHEKDVQNDAVAAYVALATLLARSTGRWMFGTQPSSLDAALFAHLDTMRTTTAGSWVRTAAPSLISYYANAKHQLFSEELDISSDENEVELTTTSSSTTLHENVRYTGTYGSIGSSHLLVSVTGCENCFAATAAAIERQWKRRRAVTRTITARRHEAQTAHAMATQAAAVGSLDLVTPSLSSPHVPSTAAEEYDLFGVDSVTLASGQRDAAIANGTFVRDAALTATMLGVCVGILFMNSTRTKLTPHISK